MERTEGEIYYFFRAWVCVFFSLTYAYLISRRVREGLPRLLLLLPIVFLFLLLPLHLTSTTFGTSFAFLISWLANFKFLLLAFDKGPLSSYKSISLLHFLAISCLPTRTASRQRQSQSPSRDRPESHLKRRNRAMLLPKVLLLGVLMFVFMFELSVNWNRNLVLLLVCLYVYLVMETFFVMIAAIVLALSGVELEQAFNEPYFSTSLQDFWGRRWNLVVSDILWLTVYEPCRTWTSSFMIRKWAPLPAVVATFAVSGLMHELLYFYFGRVWPTWEVTNFFIFYGLSLTVEITLKKIVAGKFLLPSFISRPLTLGLVAFTSICLFFPQFLRSGSAARIFEEYAAIGAFLKNVTLLLISDPVNRNDL